MSDDRIPDSVNRRRFLLGAGAAAGVGGLGAGAASQQGTPTENETATAGGDTETPAPSDDAPQVRPAFGYPAYAEQEVPFEADHTVELRERVRNERTEWFFEPVGLAVEPGDTILFRSVSPWHTVTAYHPRFGYTQRIPDDDAAVNSPVLMEGMDFYYAFRVPGVYDLNCQIHEWDGMVVRIVAGEATGPGAEPIQQVPPGAPEPDPLPVDDQAPEEPPLVSPYGAARTVHADEALAPERILEQGSVSWNEIAEESIQTPTTPGSPTETEGN